MFIYMYNIQIFFYCNVGKHPMFGKLLHGQWAMTLIIAKCMSVLLWELRFLYLISITSSGQYNKNNIHIMPSYVMYILYIFCINTTVSLYELVSFLQEWVNRKLRWNNALFIHLTRFFLNKLCITYSRTTYSNILASIAYQKEVT